MCLKLFSVWHNRTVKLRKAGERRVCLVQHSAPTSGLFCSGTGVGFQQAHCSLASRCSVCEQDVLTDCAKHDVAMDHVLCVFVLRLYLYLLCSVLVFTVFCTCIYCALYLYLLCFVLVFTVLCTCIYCVLYLYLLCFVPVFTVFCNCIYCVCTCICCDLYLYLICFVTVFAVICTCIYCVLYLYLL